MAIDLDKIFPDSTISYVGNFSNGLAAVSFSTETFGSRNLVFIDKTGKVKLSFPKVAGFKEFVNGMACVEKETFTEDNRVERRFVFFDTRGEEIKLQSTKPYDHVVAISPDYVFLGAKDATEKVYVLARESGKLIYETEGKVAGFSGPFMLTRVGLFDLRELVRLPNTILWTFRPEPIRYTNLAEALKVKEEVRHAFFYKPVSMPLLYSFSNLEELDLSNQNDTYLPPGINKLVHFSDSVCPNFHTLQRFPWS